jgi:hypothetical protein
MGKREKILLILLVSAVVGWRGLPILRAMVLGRLDDDSRRIEALKASAAGLDEKEFKLQINQRRMSDWKDRSLPPEPAEAQRLYQEWLNDLAELAGISALRVTPEPMQVTPNTSIRAVRVSVKGQATFEQLTYFLHEFHRVDLLHRIQALKVEGPPNPGGPLKIVLTAEGLCLQDTPSRNHLFPRTELADSLPRSFDTLKVASAEGFPKEAGFTVRIDNPLGAVPIAEFVTVTKVSGNQWTVQRAAEGTSKAYHAAKADVELFPVRYDQRDLKLEDRRKALAKHPFVQPVPPQVQIADSSDLARQTRLMGTIFDGDQSAWLYNQSTKSNTVVHKETPISVGDIQGTVVAIEPTAIQIKRGNDVWQLAIGKDLRSMTRVAAGGDDSILSGFSEDSPGPSGGESRNAGGRERFRSRRSRRSEASSDPEP